MCLPPPRHLSARHSPHPRADLVGHLTARPTLSSLWRAAGNAAPRRCGAPERRGRRHRRIAVLQRLAARCVTSSGRPVALRPRGRVKHPVAAALAAGRPLDPAALVSMVRARRADAGRPGRQPGTNWRSTAGGACCRCCSLRSPVRPGPRDRAGGAAPRPRRGVHRTCARTAVLAGERGPDAGRGASEHGAEAADLKAGRPTPELRNAVFYLASQAEAHLHHAREGAGGRRQAAPALGPGLGRAIPFSAQAATSTRSTRCRGARTACCRSHSSGTPCARDKSPTHPRGALGALPRVRLGACRGCRATGRVPSRGGQRLSLSFLLTASVGGRGAGEGGGGVGGAARVAARAVRVTINPTRRAARWEMVSLPVPAPPCRSHHSPWHHHPHACHSISEISGGTGMSATR